MKTEKTITVRIFEKSVTVNGDSPTPFEFNRMLLEDFKHDRIDEAGLKTLGHSIYGAIFSTQLRERLLKGKEEVLIVIESSNPVVHEIPFELLNQNPTLDEQTGYLLKDPRFFLLRNTDAQKSFAPAPATPLKMLLVISQPLRIMDERPIDPLRELGHLRKALESALDGGWVELDVLEQASLSRLRERLGAHHYDIIHYSGHGNRAGQLIFEDDEDPTRPKFVEAEDLEEVLRANAPRFLYLDSCEGAATEDGVAPSLAQRLYALLPQTAVVANILSIRDAEATQSVKDFYGELFGDSETAGKSKELFGDSETAGKSKELFLHKALAKIRRDPGLRQWYLSVGFFVPEEPLFKVEKAADRQKDRVMEYDFEHRRDLVYRYRLFRRASDLIENENYLQLCGVGGAGKSTMAQYLCEFHKERFDHVVFVDFEEEEIQTPEDLWTHLEDPKFFDIEGDFRRTDEHLAALQARGRILLVLDNVQGVIQDRDGRIVKAWRRAVDRLCQASGIFVIFTSRHTLYRGRDPLGNLLALEEYEAADLRLLLQALSHGVEADRAKAAFLMEHFEAIMRRYGAHPYALALILQQRNLNAPEADGHFMKLFDFYLPEWREHPAIGALCRIPIPIEEAVLNERFGAEKGRMLDLQMLKMDKNSCTVLPVMRLVERHDPTLKAVIDAQIPRVIDALEKSNAPLAHISALGLTEDPSLQAAKLAELWVALDDRKELFVPMIVQVLPPGETLVEAALQWREDAERAPKIGNLAHFYQSMGQSELAEKLYKKVLEIYRKLAQNNPGYEEDVAMTLKNLANLYSRAGRLEEAKEHYQEVIELYRKLAHSNPMHKGDLAGTLGNLANLYNDIGCIEKSEENYKETLNIFRELADNNPLYKGNLASTLGNLANLYKDIGCLEKSEENYKEALNIYRELAKSNPLYKRNLALILNNLATLYSDTGRLKEVEEYYKEALEYYGELDESIPYNKEYVTATLHNLADLYQKLGRLEEAEEHYQDALKRFRELAENNPIYKRNLAHTLANLGILYNRINHLEKAEECYQEVLKIYRELSQYAQYKVYEVITLINLAAIYHKTRHLKEAEDYYNEALEILGKLTESDPGYEMALAGTLSNLANLYSDTGRQEEAEVHYQDALRRYRKLVQSNSSHEGNLAMTLSNLANLYSDTGRQEEAETHYQKALERYRKMAQNNPGYEGDVATTLNNLATLYKKTERWQHYFKIFKEYYEAFAPLAQGNPAYRKMVLQFWLRAAEGALHSGEFAWIAERATDYAHLKGALGMGESPLLALALREWNVPIEPIRSLREKLGSDPRFRTIAEELDLLLSEETL